MSSGGVCFSRIKAEIDYEHFFGRIKAENEYEKSYSVCVHH